MTPERWQQVKGVLQEALDLTPEQRPAFLERACSTDHSLRREVQSLLSSSNDVRSSFLKSSPNAGLTLSKGTRLGDFEILSLLGAGGMGEVYRARDHRLDRDVAIKVLPRFVSFDRERLQRFEQEAKAAAALNHPNILAVFQMGTYEGAPYLVSELLEGETLREQLKHGPMPLMKAIDHGVQIVQGLAAAHGKGIVHRDLKPENLFVTTDGQIKILDFGLAKLTHHESETKLTKETLDTEPGAVLGTVGYMSPEQVRGQIADHRSDIFAFGAILYEMLSGNRAFHKPTSVETMNAILNEEPPLLSRVAPNISPALGQAVHRCLEKDPEHRFQSATELVSVLPASAETQPHASVLQTRKTAVRAGLAVAALLALSALSIGLNVGGLRDRPLRGVGSPAIRSLAVLPLANLTGDSGQDYFVDGMTDELTTDLAQIAALRVTSRTSTMQFRDAKKPLSQIAKELNVEAVMEGSVVRSADRVRITAQLIEAKSDRHLWAKSYERKIQDVLALQDEVARDIAEEVRIKLTPEERSRFEVARPVNPGAHDDYLRGRFWWSKRTEEGEWKGLEYFQKAIAKEPSYALAYAGVADSFIVLGHHGRLSPKEALPKAKQAAMKALELDDSLAEAHTSLALVRHSYDWDWSGAESEFKQAIVLNPNYSTAHHWYSHYLVAVGRLDEALSEVERARELDPFSPTINAFLGDTLYYRRQYDRSLRQYRHALEMYPDATEFHDGIANVYEQKKMLPEAFAERQQVLAMHGQTKTAVALAQVYKNSGYMGYLQKRIEILEQAPEPAEAPNLYLAHLYAELNDQPHALHYLERAYEERNPWLLNLKVDPAMDPLRSSPAFRDLVRRIGLPQL